MKYICTYLLILCFACIEMGFTKSESAVWGFYGHRKINRMAVFTLPQDMIGFYKKNIEFITEHAVDPDKRRYAIKEEAVRHYIDIDHWGEDPFNEVPRQFEHAFWKYAELSFLNIEDTIERISLLDGGYDLLELEQFYQEHIAETRQDELWTFSGKTCKQLKDILSLDNKATEVRVEDKFSAYGILPYHLHGFYWRLVNAFKKKSRKNILRFSAEMGHYIGDAHVPLHTTENYNGQLSDQLGIHAFWESRIPELFADDSYNFFVGKADYKEDMHKYIWSVVEDSHMLLDSVLVIEKRLSIHFPENQQFCFDERLERTVRVQCPEYAEAYQLEMDGMVEQRMRDAVKSLGTMWYSAWVEAGSPDLNVFDNVDLEVSEEQRKLEEQFKGGKIYGREH